MGTTTRRYTERSDPLVARRAADAWGVLSVAELHACGLDDDAIAWRVRRGRLHRVHHGVYAVGHSAIAPEGRWLAAVKACGPQALLSHASAAMLYGLLPRDGRRPEVLVPHAGRRAPSGIRTHRTRVLHADEVWRRRGIRVTSPDRTIFDMARTTTDRGLRRLMSRGQSMNLVKLRVLARQLDRAAGRPGRARYARVLAGTPPRTRTDLEDRVHDLILAGGFEPPDVNITLHLGGRRVVPDFRWARQRLCVEADSRQWHDNPQQREDDAERQALLEAHGERLIRITWQQATEHIAQSHARLRNAGAPTPRARP